jgi:hypothetical protein
LEKRLANEASDGLTYRNRTDAIVLFSERREVRPTPQGGMVLGKTPVDPDIC